MDLVRANAETTKRDAAALGRILVEAVAEGAGLGYLPPLAPADATAYFEGVAAEIAKGSRILIIARVGGDIAGSAQLDLCQRPNGLHRAECQKVMVASAFRRHGVGRALMAAIDQAAREAGRTTLHLDTFADQKARVFYESCGWTHAGDIPEFALTLDGRLGATSLYYKLLSR